MDDAIRDFRRIDDTLSLGGQPTESQLAELAGTGFAVVINLGLHDDRRYALADEAGTVRALGMEYVHIPVPFDHPTGQHLDAFFAAMESHRGKTIFVHCAANKRATVFHALYRILVHGEAPDTAFAVMRSVWEPDEEWSGFIAEMLT